MVYIDIKTQNGMIGRMEIRNLLVMRRGKTKYIVRYDLGDHMIVESMVWHQRKEGIIKLMAIAAKALHKSINEFLSLPQDKIVDGAIKCSEIPRRYLQSLNKAIPVCTGTIIDGESAMFVSDIESWLCKMKNGTGILWD